MGVNGLCPRFSAFPRLWHLRFDDNIGDNERLDLLEVNVGLAVDHRVEINFRGLNYQENPASSVVAGHLLDLDLVHLAVPVQKGSFFVAFDYSLA